MGGWSLAGQQTISHHLILSGRCLHCTDLSHRCFCAQHRAAWSCTGQPAAQSCTDRQATAAARRWIAKQRQLHGVARTCGRAIPPIYPKANRPSILPRILATPTLTTDLEMHGPPCISCMAFNRPEDQLCCTELHRLYGVNNCTEIHGPLAAVLQVSRGCTSLHGTILTI